MKKIIFKVLLVAVLLATTAILGSCDIIPMLGGNTCDHDLAEPVIEKEVAATCTADGSYDEVVYCSVEGCGAEISRKTVVIPKLGHTEGDWITVKDASCISEGKAEKKCSRCLEVIEEKTIEMLADHVPGEAVTENEVAATCAAAGSYDEVVYCTVLGCGCEISRVNKVIPRLDDHTPGEPVLENIVAADCESECTYELVVYCSAPGCGYEISREYKSEAALGHVPGTPVRENEVAPTCTLSGSYDLVVYCTYDGCGREISRESKTVDALGHTPGDVQIENSVSPTCTLGGSYDEVRYCTVLGCGAETSRESKTVDALGHTPGDVQIENSVSPTCTLGGSYDEVRYCTVLGCGAEISRENKTVDALGHTDGEWITEKEPTCLDAGLQYKQCIVCELRTAEQTLDKLSYHVGAEPTYDIITSPTCTSEGLGYEVILCKWCSFEMSKEEKTLARSPHSYVDGICSGCGVEENASNGLVFASNGDGTCTLGGIGDCADTELVVPSVSPDGDKVTSVAARAFISNTAITSLYLPSTVTSIGDYAFNNCTALLTVSITENVKHIGSFAFNGTQAAEIVGGIHYIAGWVVSSDVSIVTAEVREGTVGIASSSFYRRTKLVNVELPSSIVNIGNAAFSEATALQSIELPIGITEVAKDMCCNCTSLVTVVLGDRVTDIGESAFRGCTVLTNINIPEGVLTIGKQALSGCGGITELILPDSLTTIAESGISNLGALKTVSIGKSLAAIGNGVFQQCPMLESISVSEDNATMMSIDGHLYTSGGQVLFRYCPANPATEFTVPDHVKLIGYSALSACDNLIKVYIPSTTTEYIMDFAFSRCANLASVEIGNGVSEIREGAFKTCKKLKTVTIGSSIRVIQYDAFSLTGVTSIDIAEPGPWRVIHRDTYETLHNITITSASQAATYLKNTYSNYNWYI